MSLWRTFRSMQRVGVREWFRQMNYIGDAKSGRFVGMDHFGNRYYENLNGEEEVPGRHRWVDIAQSEYDTTQIPPGWHAWINHIKKLPPTEDKIYQGFIPPWQTEWRENLTGTPAAYKSYSTVARKINSWEPKVAQRGSGGSGTAQ